MITLSPNPKCWTLEINVSSAPKVNIEEQINKTYWTKYVKRIKKLFKEFDQDDNYLSTYTIQWVVDQPSFWAKKQRCDYWFEFEYVDQRTGYECDDYYGTMYYPLPDWKFISVSYHC